MSLLPKLVQLKTPLKKILKLVTYESGALKDGDGNTVTTSLSDGSVTNAKLSTVAANTIKTNNTSSTAAPTDLNIPVSRVVGRGPTGDIVPLIMGASMVVTDTHLGRAALTGDVTAAQDGNATTIANDAVTNAKAANMAANTVKTNNTASSADPTDLALVASTMLGRGPTGNIAALTPSGGLTISDTGIKSKGSFAFPYTFSTATTGTDPGADTVKFNNATLGSVTAVYIDPTTGSRNIGAYLATLTSGKMGFISNNSSGSAFGVFSITAVSDNTDASFYTLTVTPISSLGTMPSNGEELLLFFWPAGGLSTQDVLDMKVVRTDANDQLIDELGAVISGSPSVADYTALVALDEAQYTNFVVIVQSGLNRSGWISNGTTFTPFQGQYVQERSNTSVRIYIAPESGITWTAADNGSGKVRITSNAAHGLTTTPAVGASICVKTTQNGWTAGDFHEIATIVSTTVIDLTTNYSAHGVPVFYVKNEEVTVKTIASPVLRTNSQVILEFNVLATVDAGGSARWTKMYLDGTELNAVNLSSTTNAFTPYRWGFKNLGVTNSQRGLAGKNSTGYVLNTLAPLTAAVDTSVSKNITLTFLPASANFAMELCDYALLIRG